MTEKPEQNLNVIEGSRERVNEAGSSVSCHTNPIVRKLLDFGSANKTCKFSVRDLLKR